MKIESFFNYIHQKNLGDIKRDIVILELLWEQYILKTFGPVIPINILKKEEIERRKKTEYLKSLGVKSCDGDRKLFIGELSPSCKSCRRGEWVCMYINSSCTRDCFFCLKARRLNKTFIENLVIKNEKGLIYILQALRSNACGISGGEPLLIMDKLLRYISIIRKSFGPTYRIHLYTNGDLIDYKNMRQLKEAGLDEIRFNSYANGYNLKPIEIARKFFSDVLVEIPAVPKHEAKLYDFLIDIDKLGVRCINLHELTAGLTNIAKVKRQQYLIKNYEAVSTYDTNERPVKGSEELIFRLLEYILKKGLSISANYCSYIYKRDIQIPKRMIHLANMLKDRDPGIRVTKAGFIEKALIYGPKLKKIVKDLRKYGVPKEEIYFCSENNKLETHIDNLCYLRHNKYKENEIGLIRANPFGRIFHIKIISAKNKENKIY